MRHRLATIALGPVLFPQGFLVRRRIVRLAEPPGHREGVSGVGPPLRLLITGDSAAAGVGAPHLDDALLGHVVSGLAETAEVRWSLLAKSGATTESTLRALRKLEGQHFDVAVTTMGVNDVSAGLKRNTWREQQALLRHELQTGLGVRHHVVCGLPPVHRFPGLPQPLRWHLGRRAREFDSDLARDVDAATNCSFVNLNLDQGAENMASDGFHPGPPIYRAWGERVVQVVRERLRSRADA